MQSNSICARPGSSKKPCERSGGVLRPLRLTGPERISYTAHVREMKKKLSGWIPVSA